MVRLSRTLVEFLIWNFVMKTPGCEFVQGVVTSQECEREEMLSQKMTLREALPRLVWFVPLDTLLGNGDPARARQKSFLPL